ncbi:MAG TPA: DinB family protein [Candidatus Sulfotelmatobacter sp.]|nr:DinB family protein [Candidatus Sulfotelmatobacter sp.]
MIKNDLPEPWLRGTLVEVPALQRAVLHALELAREDLERWCDGLSDEELNQRPGGIAPVSFHLRHIARSMDRLLSYAEGKQLSPEQIAAMKLEANADATRNELMAELVVAFAKSGKRIRSFQPQQMEEERRVGKKQLPTSVGSLLVHVADHTQRHVGQAITTAKIVVAQRSS